MSGSKDSGSPSLSVTRRPAGRVTPLRSYGIATHHLRDHEETLVFWWGLAREKVNQPAFWNQVADWCHGAWSAMVNVRGKEVAAHDYMTAERLAESRAYLEARRELPESLREGAC